MTTKVNLIRESDNSHIATMEFSDAEWSLIEQVSAILDIDPENLIVGAIKEVVDNKGHAS